MSTPYVGFGNDQLDAAPELAVSIKCPRCGEQHLVQESKGSQTWDGTTRTWLPSSNPTRLQYYKCGEQIYLAGINGKSVMKTKPACSGEVGP
jgi:hypothetical protein